MFALRLRVNVLPRQPSSSRLAPAKPASFLLVVQQPEKVTLGGLAGMIQTKWRKLHPELDSLAIKKLLDGANEDVDLDPDLTVADVWVDRGKQRADGMDQRGTVLVIQKPTPYAPERFPSVVLDWEAAAQEFERTRKTKTKEEAVTNPLGAIEEDEESESRRVSTSSFSSSRLLNHHSPDEVRSSVTGSPVEHRHRDLPLSSVERPEEHSLSPKRKDSPSEPVVTSTPPPRIQESVELGGSPTVAKRPQSRKRKPSLEEPMPVKHPRLEEPRSPAEPQKPVSSIATSNATLLPPNLTPIKKRARTPSISSPHRRPSHSDLSKDKSKHGLGLGITRSPTSKPSAMVNQSQDPLRNGDLPSTQSSIPSFAPNAACFSTPKQGTVLGKKKLLQSALHQESSSKPQERRSVSFADEDDLVPTSHPAPKSTSQDVVSKPFSNTPAQPSTESSQDTAVSSSIVFPPGFTDARILELTREAEQEEQERQDIERKLKLPNADPKYLELVREMHDIWHLVQKGIKSRTIHKVRVPTSTLRKKLPDLRRRLLEFEKNMTLPPSIAKPVGQRPSSAPTPQTQPVTSGKATANQASTAKQPLSMQKETPSKTASTPETQPVSSEKATAGHASTIKELLFTQRKTAPKPSTTPQTQPASSGKTISNHASTANQPLSTQSKTTIKPSTQRKTPPKQRTKEKTPGKAAAAELSLPPSAGKITRPIGNRATQNTPSTSSSSSDEDEESDDSEIDFGTKPAPKKSPTPALPTTNPPRPFSSPLRSAEPGNAPSPSMAPPPASQPVRTTLKSLLRAQKEAQATQTTHQVAPLTRPAPHRAVFDGPSSSESEQSDSEDNGDILPNGQTTWSRKPWA